MLTDFVNERDQLHLYNYEFYLFYTRLNKRIIIKMYIRTIFHHLLKSFSNIQR